MTELIDNPPPLPEPAFRLNWHDDGARYTVSKPNIDSTDCYTAAQYRAGEAAAFARGVAAGRNAGLEEAIQKVPGGDSCNPQHVADEIRSLKQ